LLGGEEDHSTTNPFDEVSVEFFQKLGGLVLSRWRERNLDLASFPEVSQAALEELPPSEHVSSDDIIDWVMRVPVLPPQANPLSDFGEPPFTVFVHERFAIEVLFWVDGTTSIHEHSFSGAFHVLAGSSVHTRYQFTEERRYNELLSTGRLDLDSIERLTRGSTRRILPGRRLVHSLFHLDCPSVSVVIRTHRDEGAGHQGTFDRAGFCVASFFEPVGVLKRRQTLTLLSKIAPDKLSERAREVIAEADSFGAYMLMDHMRRLLPTVGLMKEFLDSIRPPHEELARRFAVRSENTSRETYISRRRSIVRDSDHRFFLAVLLNAPTRASALDLIARCYPDRSPVDSVVEWLKQLAATSPDGGDANPLGLKLDDVALRVLRYLLEGATDADVIERLRDEYDADDVASQTEDVLRLGRALRRQPLLQPLLA
jgi:hypothetical protein